MDHPKAMMSNALALSDNGMNENILEMNHGYDNKN